MEISRASGAAWNQFPLSSTAVGNPSPNDVNSALTPSDLDFLSKVHGRTFTPGGATSLLAIDIREARRNGALSPNQPVSASFIADLQKRYPPGSDDVYSAILQRARALAEQDGPLFDRNV